MTEVILTLLVKGFKQVYGENGGIIQVTMKTYVFDSQDRSGTVSLSHALRRGIFHALAGLACAFAILSLSRFTMLVTLAAVTAAFLSLEVARLRIPSLKRRFSVWFACLLREEEVSKATGSSYFLVSCLITVLLFPRNIAALAILFLSLGDPAATVVGMWKGRTRLWGKSMEGNAACLGICLFTAILVSIVLQEPPLTVAVAGAVLATVIQSLPVRLNDNLTIPIGSAVAMLVASIIT